jgi:hypothetical protein
LRQMVRKWIAESAESRAFYPEFHTAGSLVSTCAEIIIHFAAYQQTMNPLHVSQHSANFSSTRRVVL